MTATTPPATISVLMYHSIADVPGPTSIAPATFTMHMRVLAASGHEVIPFRQVGEWLRTGAPLPAHAVAITFDDGFADFLPAADVLHQHRFPATVFLPTGRIGFDEDWSGTGTAPRPLLRWNEVAELASAGVEFGGHSMSHPRLTALDPARLEAEISGSRQAIEERLGVRPTTFAPPYGDSNAAVRAAIARWFECAAGTVFGRVMPASDAFDVPRIEMHYYRTEARWNAFLEGRGEWYLRGRQLLRSVRQRAARLGATG